MSATAPGVARATAGLRVFVAPGEAPLAAVVAALTTRLPAPPRVERVEPYWKEEGWHVVTWELGEWTAPEEALGAVTQALGTGWVVQADGWDSSATWNPGAGASFVDAHVRFASVEILQRRAPAPVRA